MTAAFTEHDVPRRRPLTHLVRIAIGAWLFISVFAWPHARAQGMNTAVLGGLIVLLGVLGFAVPATRYALIVLALWLFFSTWILPVWTSPTVWNNVLVAVALFVASLVPSRAPPPGHESGLIVGSRSRER